MGLTLALSPVPQEVVDTQSFRQPITEHQIVFGRCRTSGPVVFLHSATDDEGRADGFLHVVVVLAAHRVCAIGDVFLNGTASTDAKFAGLLRIDRALGDTAQAANANLVADTGGQWTAAHRGQGRAYLAVRLKLRPEAFPSDAPSLSAIVEGADTILDPRTGATGWSDNPALCLAWYLTSPFGWRASWADIDLPALMAAAMACRAPLYRQRRRHPGRGRDRHHPQARRRHGRCARGLGCTMSPVAACPGHSKAAIGHESGPAHFGVQAIISDERDDTARRQRLADEAVSGPVAGRPAAAIPEDRDRLQPRVFRCVDIKPLSRVRPELLARGAQRAVARCRAVDGRQCQRGDGPAGRTPGHRDCPAAGQQASSFHDCRMAWLSPNSASAWAAVARSVTCRCSQSA